MIQAASPRSVVANVLCADEPGSPRKGVGTGARLQFLMRSLNPIDAQVRHPRHLGVGLPYALHVVVAESRLQKLCAKERRVPDDHIGLEPRRLAAVRHDQSVDCSEVRIKVVERQCRLADMQFVDAELVCEHHRHPGYLDSERVDIHPIEVRCRQQAEGSLGGVLGLREQLCQPGVQLGL